MPGRSKYSCELSLKSSAASAWPHASTPVLQINHAMARIVIPFIHHPVSGRMVGIDARDNQFHQAAAYTCDNTGAWINRCTKRSFSITGAVRTKGYASFSPILRFRLFKIGRAHV